MTRQSIVFAKKMDARVRPAHDQFRAAAARMNQTARSLTSEKYPRAASSLPVLRSFMRKPLTRRENSTWSKST